MNWVINLPYWWQARICSGYTWSDVEPNLCCHLATPDHNVLMKYHNCFDDHIRYDISLIVDNLVRAAISQFIPGNNIICFLPCFMFCRRLGFIISFHVRHYSWLLSEVNHFDIHSRAKQYPESHVFILVTAWHETLSIKSNWCDIHYNISYFYKTSKQFLQWYQPHTRCIQKPYLNGHIKSITTCVFSRRANQRHNCVCKSVSMWFAGLHTVVYRNPNLRKYLENYITPHVFNEHFISS